jgi:ABC-type nitrate/sulfonate/bicarbonate transport system substrate-binding protein
MLKNRAQAAASMLMAVALVAACSTPAAPTSAPAATRSALDMTPAEIRFGQVANISFPTLIVAESQGLFDKENLVVKKEALNSSAGVTEALLAGSVDMGQATLGPAILARLKGGKVVLVSAIENAFTEQDGKSWEGTYLVVRSGEGIKSWSDLKGRKVSAGDVGSSTSIIFRAKLIDEHIDPDKDLTLMSMQTGQKPSALAQKLIDAAVMSGDEYAQALKMGNMEAIAVQTSMEGVDMSVSSAVGVNVDYLAKNRAVVTRFLRAMLQARQWLAEDVAKNGGKGQMAAVAKAMGYTDEQAKTLYDTRGGYYGKDVAFVNLLDIPTRLAMRHVQILKTAGVLGQDVPATYEQLVDTGPLNQAYESLGLTWDASKH